MSLLRYDFGYAWPWTLGHAIPIAIFGLLIAIARWRRWPTWSVILFCLPVAWGIVGLWIVNVALRFSLPVALPTEAFLSSGAGHVLDAGAGSGRSTLMVLLERPQTSVVALDIFADGYGIAGNTPERLWRNARAANAADRIDVVTGDMRHMPLPSDTFDGAVSAFAIDHLPREDVPLALGEIRRVLKPRGEFLLLVIRADGYLRLAYPLAAQHGYFGPYDAASMWMHALASAGFEVAEQGTQPGTSYLLARSPD